ncbi:hypothetical protein [Roseibium sp.]|uniref:hypothetical protein n=1 Tax=Roseibium sp. TaxID=1936156 RepID=UPI003D12F1AD
MRNRRDHKKPFKKEKIGAGAKENPDTQPPLFSFEKMALNTGYSVDCCDTDNQAALSKRLFKLSQMKWRDIRQAPRHGLGTETKQEHRCQLPFLLQSRKILQLLR